MAEGEPGIKYLTNLPPYPPYIRLPHKVTHPEKLDELTYIFQKWGWDRSKPALVGYRNGEHVQLLSGTHRAVAAFQAGLKHIPVVV